MSADPSHHDPNSVELPTPTAWPIVVSFGLLLLFSGLVTNLFVSAVGLLTTLIGAIGWFGDVFPHPKHETVLLRPESERAVISPSQYTVKRLHLGEHGHRVRIPIEVHPYSAGVLGGIAGGIVMAILACGYGYFAYGSIWFPINLLAASGVPELAEASKEQLMQFSMPGLLVGILAHGSISVLVGLLYAVLLPMLPPRWEWFWGGIFTPLLWSGLVFATLGFVNPAMAAMIDWPSFVVCQVAFGVVGGFIVFKSAKVETMQSLPLAAKMGVEAALGEDHP